jgi:hypothetical protein
MKITKYRPNEPGHALIGFFNVVHKIKYGPNFEFEGVIFHNEMKLFRKDGKEWVSFADRQFKAIDGLSKYFPFTGWTQREVSENFQKQVFKALNDFFHEEVKAGRSDLRLTGSTQDQRNANQSQGNNEIHYPHVHCHVQKPQEEINF